MLDKYAYKITNEICIFFNSITIFMSTCPNYIFLKSDSVNKSQKKA